MDKYQGKEPKKSINNEKVFLAVTNDSYQDSCVIKLIECIDHSHGTAILNQLNNFNHIRHYSLLPYREVFLHWDQSESALYVAVVTDFQKNGSLHELIENFDDSTIPEQKIKNWMANIIDALIVVHDYNKQSHNNLKSSNVYLADRGRILLGDPLPATALLSRKNRNSLSGKASKPQISIGEIEDIRGAGSIAFDLTKKGVDSGHIYSPELMEIVSILLDGKVSLAKLAVENEYLKSSLQAIGSPHVPPAPLISWPHNRIRVPVELGIPGILSYMDSHRNYFDCLQAAISELSRIFVQTPHALASMDVQFFLSILESAAASSEVQTTAFRFLIRLRYDVDPGVYVRLLSDNLFAYSARILNKSQDFPDVIIAVNDLFSLLAEDSRVAHRLVASGLIPILTKALKTQIAKKEEGAASSASLCGLLFRLSVVDSAAEKALEAEVLPPLIECLHVENLNLQKKALSAMVSLAMEPDSFKIFLKTQAFETICITLCRHYSDAEIALLSCTVLSSLVEKSTESAFGLLLLPLKELPDEETGILGVILDTYRIHADHGSVVEACAHLLAAISHHPDVVTEFANCPKAEETVDEIARRYRDRDSIVEDCRLMKDALNKQKQPDED